MKRLKKMIFNLTNDYNLNDDQQRLIFGIFKDSAKTKQLNPAIWLYLNNYNSFNDILEDIVHQAILYNYEQVEMLKQIKPEQFNDVEELNKELERVTSYAYKATMRYIYHQHYKVQAKNRKLDLIENKYKVGISGASKPVEIYKKYNINLETVEQAEYWNNLVDRTNKYTKTKRCVFINNKQKTKTMNQLKRLEIIK